MKTINLIKRRAISIIEIKKYRKNFLLVFASLNLILIVFVVRFFIVSSQLESSMQEYRNLENAINEIKKNINEQEILFFKNFFSKIGPIGNLIKNKRYISFILYKIGEFLPEDFYIGSLEFQQKEVSLQIYVLPSKEGGEIDKVNEFVSKLENTEFFLRGKTQISSQGSAELDGSEMLFFQISLKIA